MTILPILPIPTQGTEPLDAIKYVPLPIAPGAYGTFGIDDRERIKASCNALVAFGYRPAQAYDLHRLLFDADAHVAMRASSCNSATRASPGAAPGRSCWMSIVSIFPR